MPFLAMPSRTGRLAALAALLVLAAAGGCSDDEVDSEAQTQYVGVRRAWRAGERDSIVASVLANRSWDGLPYVGDLSDYVDLILDPDSTTDAVLNPGYVPAPSLMGPSPLYDVRGIHVPGTGWTMVGMDLKLQNDNPGETDYDWLGAFWSLDASPDRKGIALANTASATYPATTVNTALFDSLGTRPGAGEIDPTSVPVTYWENQGEGGTYRVQTASFSGTPTTITSGPYTGGELRSGTQRHVLNKIRMNRRSGSASPAQLMADINTTITASEITCIFPTPCTTNVPGLAAAALRGPLPDSLYIKLPWIAAMPAEQQAAHLLARRTRR
jgi:hypothetical protein